MAPLPSMRTTSMSRLTSPSSARPARRRAGRSRRASRASRGRAGRAASSTSGASSSASTSASESDLGSERAWRASRARRRIVAAQPFAQRELEEALERREAPVARGVAALRLTCHAGGAAGRWRSRRAAPPCLRSSHAANCAHVAPVALERVGARPSSSHSPSTKRSIDALLAGCEFTSSFSFCAATTFL